jgi:hypothetical protein
MPSDDVAADDEPETFGGGDSVSGCDVLHLSQYGFLVDGQF